MASHRSNPSNYFEHPNCFRAIRNREPQLQAIESTLQQIDTNAWQVFTTRTARSVTATDRWGWNRELFDHFDEAKAYSYLKDEGYSDIQFIQESNEAKTPDLWGNGKNGAVSVEVKSIHESDDENDYLTSRGEYEQEKNARRVECSLNDAARAKLEKTIRVACEQLAYQGKGSSRKILFLCIRLDLRCATEATIADLKGFLDNVRPNGIEIVHEIKNTIIL